MCCSNNILTRSALYNDETRDLRVARLTDDKFREKVLVVLVPETKSKTKNSTLFQ